MALLNNLANPLKIFGASLGSLLIGVVAVPTSASAQTIAQMSSPATGIVVTPGGPAITVPLAQIEVADLAPYPRNPCPRIYYEYPFNQRVVVPQTCPANTITQQLSRAGLLPMIRDRATQNQVGTPGTMGAPYTNYPSPSAPKPVY